MIIESVITANKNYHPQTLLDECKYEIKKNKMENLTIDDFDSSSSDESDSERDSEPDINPDNESDNDESNESKN